MDARPERKPEETDDEYAARCKQYREDFLRESNWIRVKIWSMLGKIDGEQSAVAAHETCRAGLSYLALLALMTGHEKQFERLRQLVGR